MNNIQFTHIEITTYKQFIQQFNFDINTLKSNI